MFADNAVFMSLSVPTPYIEALDWVEEGVLIPSSSGLRFEQLVEALVPEMQ